MYKIILRFGDSDGKEVIDGICDPSAVSFTFHKDILHVRTPGRDGRKIHRYCFDPGETWSWEFVREE